MAFASKSPWVIHYDASSCNGCDIEVLATLCPGFDAERFGVINTGNPKHADIFLVTGSVNERNISVVKEIYDQMLEPKVVVACGICACSGGIFHDCYNVIGGVDQAIPVDVYAPGCAVRPETLIDAVVEAIGILDKKSEALKLAGKGKHTEASVASAASAASEVPDKPEVSEAAEPSLENPDVGETEVSEAAETGETAETNDAHKVDDAAADVVSEISEADKTSEVPSSPVETKED